MNATVSASEPVIPTPEDFGAAWSAFFWTVSAIATFRAKKYGPERFGKLSQHAARLLDEAGHSDDLLSSVAEMAEDEHEKVSLGILYEELLFVAWRYRGAFELAGVQTPDVIILMSPPPQFANEEGHPDDPDAVDDIETIKGSIQKLLDKLPRWMQKAIDVILEALKLTRGLVH